VAGIELSQNVALRAVPQLSMRPSPALVAATALLALTAVELEQTVELELTNTPALERREPTNCHLCGGPRVANSCRSCDRPYRTSERATDRDGRIQGGNEAVAEPTLAETLLEDLVPMLIPRDKAIAVYLLGSLDERGFLDATVEGVADQLRLKPQVVGRVLDQIQATGPPGLAARDLRECLLLQLDRHADRTPACDLARQVVAEHLELLGTGQYGAVARKLGVERTEVAAAAQFIRERLSPHPALALTSTAQPPPLTPDMVVRDADNGLAVEVLERDRHQLVVSPIYERALSAPLPEDARETIRRQLVAAREFVDRLEQRWRTMAKVTEVAVSRQREFVRGSGQLSPLTRAEVARELGVHESTVSRAVAGRNVLLPGGRVVPLASLFGRSSASQDALAELVAAEVRPKSDAELAEDLARLGFAVARRTVTKYRERLGILPSSLRQPAKPASHLSPA
jgi:RNA polymerase sigma-54 factor